MSRDELEEQNMRQALTALQAIESPAISETTQAVLEEMNRVVMKILVEQGLSHKFAPNDLLTFENVFTGMIRAYDAISTNE